MRAIQQAVANPPVQEDEAEVESEPEPEPNKKRSRGRPNRRLAENRARAYALRKRDQLQLVLRHLAKEVWSFFTHHPSKHLGFGEKHPCQTNFSEPNFLTPRNVNY